MLEFKAINIHQVLERVYWVLKAEVGDSIHFVRDYDPSLPELWADLDQLIQVVLEHCSQRCPSPAGKPQLRACTHHLAHPRAAPIHPWQHAPSHGVLG